MLHVVNLGHVSLPVVLSRERLAAQFGVVAPLNSTMVLLLLLVSIVDVPLQMSLGPETFAASRIRALMIFRMIALVVSEKC